MDSPYIEMRNGGYYVAGTRVSLDSVVYAHRRGDDLAFIQEQFPAMTLDQVRGALSFYFEHRAEVDENIREARSQWSGP